MNESLHTREMNHVARLHETTGVIHDSFTSTCNDSFMCRQNDSAAHLLQHSFYFPMRHDSSIQRDMWRHWMSHVAQGSMSRDARMSNCMNNDWISLVAQGGVPPAPMNHVNKGRPRQNAFSKLVHRQYKSFPPDRFCQVEIKKTTELSSKHRTT